MHEHQHPVGETSHSVGDFFQRLLDTDFMQRGECVSWRPEIVGLHVASDAIIAVAYYSIPIALLYFVRRRRDLAFHWMFVMFAAFILACGTTHVMGVLAFWWPLYRLDGVLKAITGLLSIATAISLWTLIPKALALPSPASMRLANDGFVREVAERNRVQEELRRAHGELEARVAERTSELERLNAQLTAEVAERKKVEAGLRASEERFRLAIKSAPIAVFNQDRELRYTWMNNGQFEGHPADVIGKRDSELFEPEAAAKLTSLKRGVLAGNGNAQAEIEIGSPANRRFFEFRAEPLRDSSGAISGITGVKFDITERKRAEQHRSFLLAELDHRVKNNLATILALAEESIRFASSLEEFRLAFTSRVRALARTHTALATAKWEGVRLDELANLILSPYLQSEPPRVVCSGEAIMLSSKAASAMCLILNELATNAAKYGALSATGGGDDEGSNESPIRGHVELTWARRKAEAGASDPSDRLCVTWTERGGPAVTPPKRRGVGTDLIEGGAAYELGGTASLEFRPEGVCCTLVFPLNPQNTRKARFEEAVLHSGSASQG